MTRATLAHRWPRPGNPNGRSRRLAAIEPGDAKGERQRNAGPRLLVPSPPRFVLSHRGSSTGLRGTIRRPPCQPSACSNCVRPQSIDEHFGHALVEAWLLAADRLTDEGDGREDFPGRNVVARVPAVYRSGEERVERRFEPVQQVLREVIVGRVT